MRVFRPLAVLAVTCAVGLLAAPAPAWAHNELRASNPAKGARLATAPVEVTLDFAERLDPRFTTVAVTDAAGKAVTSGKPKVEGVRAVQPLNQPLDPGDYTVAYRVVSVDGHPVRGSHTFTVTAPPTTAPPTAPPTQPVPSPTATTTNAAATTAAEPEALVGDEQDGGGNILPGLLLGGVAVLAIGTGILLVRQRRTREP
ncbi:copper resistance protein CopC [Micromonospora sp. NPDC050417]|uniref:copper resistance protein CopC n=1 Tax=Micromonospora sp. NPDC050417 TaxID=3364280 RepID=UPI003791114E